MGAAAAGALPDISVCIATYQRPAGLERLLVALTRQKLPEGLRFEVLVVDNDAAGTAATLLERFQPELPLRAFVEPRRNIAHARNRALNQARGRWVAFVDDDEAPGEEWLAAYWHCVESGDADAWLGPVTPRLEEVRTPWIDVERFYGRPRHATGTELGIADFATSNALVRRSWLDVRRFDPNLGCSGGSDTELFARLQHAGARIAWCDEAEVTDFIPPERHRPGWLVQRAFRGGVVSTQLEGRWNPGWPLGVRRLAHASAAFLACCVAAPLAALLGRAAFLRVVQRGAIQLGHLWSMAGRGYEEYGG